MPSRRTSDKEIQHIPFVVQNHLFQNSTPDIVFDLVPHENVMEMVGLREDKLNNRERDNWQGKKIVEELLYERQKKDHVIFQSEKVENQKKWNHNP